MVLIKRCNGHSYKLDFAKNDVENFEYIEQNNIKVFIDPKTYNILIGSEMDYSSDKLASEFVFKNLMKKLMWLWRVFSFEINMKTICLI